MTLEQYIEWYGSKEKLEILWTVLETGEGEVAKEVKKEIRDFAKSRGENPIEFIARCDKPNQHDIEGMYGFVVPADPEYRTIKWCVVVGLRNYIPK